MLRTCQRTWHRVDPKYILVSLLQPLRRVLSDLNWNYKSTLCSTHDWGGRKGSFCRVSDAAPKAWGDKQDGSSLPWHTHLPHKAVLTFTRVGWARYCHMQGNPLTALGKSSGRKMLYLQPLPIICSIGLNHGKIWSMHNFRR